MFIFVVRMTVLFFFCMSLYVFNFETGSELKIIMYPKLSLYFCSSFLTDRIIGVQHHTWFMQH